MNSLVSSFINQFSGAKLVGEEVVFDTEQRSANTVCLLARTSFISVEGPDAEKFLQGQLTCDVEQLSAENSSLGAHCNAKGRAIASFRAVKTSTENFVFALPANNVENYAKSLGKYIVFSKADVKTPDLIAFGLYGDNAKEFVQQTFGTIGDNANCAQNDNGIAISLSESRYELWLTTEQALKLWPQITDGFAPTTTEQWYKQNITQLLVDIEANTSGQFVPQMFNLDANGGISFTKGCYTGQEIVARLKYLGKQKRHLVRFEYSDDFPAIGADITNEQGKALGTVLSVAPSVGLAVLSDGAVGDTLMAEGTKIVVNDGE